MADTDNGDEILREVLRPDEAPGRPRAIEWDQYVEDVLAEWRELLEGDPPESRVQRFLERHPSMVPGGSGDVGPGGHHGAELGAVFRVPELKGLGRNYRPDFMWVTRSSGLVTPILIEIEKPSKRWFRLDGRPTAAFTEAHDQLNEWRAWFARPGNVDTFRQTYLFTEDFRHRPLEPQFVLVYGRASEFTTSGPHKDPAALRNKRDTQRASGESFITFDSLRPRRDSSATMTVSMTVHGPRPYALSPTFTTGTMSGSDALILGSLSKALERSEMMTPERKAYIADRWTHWRAVEERARADRDGIYGHQPGRE